MNSKNHLIEIFCGHKHINDVAQILVHSIIFFRTHGRFNYKQQGSYSIGSIGYEEVNCDFLDLTYVRCSSLTLINRVNDKIQEFVYKLNDYNNSYQRTQSRLPTAGQYRTPSSLAHSPTICEFNLEKQKSGTTQALASTSLYAQSPNIKSKVANEQPQRQRLGSLAALDKQDCYQQQQYLQTLNRSPLSPALSANCNTYYHGTLTLEFYTRRTGRWPFNDSKLVWEQWNIRIIPMWNYNNQMNPTTPNAHATGSSSCQEQRENRLEDVLGQKLIDIVQIVNSEKCLLPQMPSQQSANTVFDMTHSDAQPYLYNILYKISENIICSEAGGSGGRHSTSSVVVDNSATPSSLKKFLLETLAL